MPLITIVNSSRDYEQLFREIGDVEDSLPYIPMSDMVVFTGGSDVSPSFYDHKSSAKLGYTDFIRDEVERVAFNSAKDAGVPMLGICRGAQFVCAMSGGKLFQHVDGHAIRGQHMIKLFDNTAFSVNSLHHQMMYPWSTTHALLAWSTANLSKRFFFNPSIGGGEDQTIPPIAEPEIVWFPETNALGIQYHPEMMPLNSRGRTKALDYAEELLETGTLSVPQGMIVPPRKKEISHV